MNFKESLWVKYPLPKSVSIWGTTQLDNDIDTDLDDLIQMCVDELASDTEVVKTINIGSVSTIMPEDCRSISNVRFNAPYQGNRYVKYNFEPISRRLTVRYFPSIVTYKCAFTIADLENVKGDVAIYIRNYIHLQMVTKELNYLGAVKLDTDTGEVDLTRLEKFRDDCQERYTALKPDILLYPNG